MNEKTGIYIRVSTEEQAKDGFSIHAQKVKLTKYAEANDWEIVDYYIDDGISGKNLVDRKEVNRLLEDIKKGLVNNVLIYKLDRLTRSMKDLIYLIEYFEKYDCTFNSQTEKIDTSNAVGRMFVKIIGIFAEFERENLAERVSLGYEQKTREGNYTNTNGVYGYNYIVGEGKLEINYLEKKLVNRIYKDYLEGNSYFKIAKALNEEKIPTKRGGKWAASTIKSILNNPLYIGKVRYGLRNSSKAFIIDKSKITPIINIELWNKVHNVIMERKNRNIRRYPSNNSYFSKISKCYRCGSDIIARQQIHNNKIYINYKCSGVKEGKCIASGFSHTKLEESFIEYLDSLEDIIPNPQIMKLDIMADDDKIIDVYQNKRKRLKKKKEIIREEYINNSLSIHEYNKLIEEINKQEKSIINECLKIKNCSNNNINYSYDQIKGIVGNLKLNWKYLLNNEKKQFLDRFIDYILVSKCEKDVKIWNVVFKKN